MEKYTKPSSPGSYREANPTVQTKIQTSAGSQKPPARPCLLLPAQRGPLPRGMAITPMVTAQPGSTSSYARCYF